MKRNLVLALVTIFLSSPSFASQEAAPEIELNKVKLTLLSDPPKSAFPAELTLKLLGRFDKTLGFTAETSLVLAGETESRFRITSLHSHQGNRYYRAKEEATQAREISVVVISAGLPKYKWLVTLKSDEETIEFGGNP